MSSLIVSYLATTAIPRHRIVKFGVADGSVALATAATDKSMGASDFEVESGDAVAIVRHGKQTLELGGTVTKGDRLVPDSEGKAVVSNPASGVVHYTIAIADDDGVVGEIINTLIHPQIVKG